jgi:beta-phosphoglucomutase
MNIQACIFDLDGVIVDTAKYHYLAWKELAHQLGFGFTLQQNERLKGVSRMRSLDILLDIGKICLTQVEKDILADKKNKWYLDHVHQMTAQDILPGVLNFLKELKQNKIKIALGSASKNAKLILQRIHLLKIFDSIIDGNNIAEAKPNPEVFLSAAKALDIAPEYCVVFEDAEAGIEAAKKAEMKAVGVGKKEDLPKADFIIASLAEMNLEKLSKIFAL